MPNRLTTALVAALLLAAAGTALAGVPAIPEIPTTLPDAVRQPLIARRAPLAQQKMALLEEGAAINRQCTGIKTGSPQHQACLGRQASFNVRAETLTGQVDTLEDEIDAAVEAEKRRVAGPHNNPNVVDGRGPRDGAWMVSRVPELARSPAADRIAKGFQAVINRDWPVTLAVWQEALQRDPGNAALRRAVGLAQWMVDRRRAVAAGPVTPLNAGIYAATRGDDAQTIRQFELAKLENPAIAAQADRMIAAIRKRSAQAAQKNAALDQDIQRTMREVTQSLLETGLNRLSIGDEKGAQEAFRDAEFFGMGLPARTTP